MVRAKMWRDAKEFYIKGLTVLTVKGGDDKWEKGEDPELEAKKEKELEEQIYVNRALCNLELGNEKVPVHILMIWLTTFGKGTTAPQLSIVHRPSA
jgi:hypothetical protein